ncbi:MAG: fatty acid CoA ligase family protein [Pseudomonadota bacterium]
MKTPSKSNNIAEALTLQAMRQPHGIALILPARKRAVTAWTDQRYTYAELNRLSDHLALGLIQLGLKPGTRVALMVPPSLEFFALFFALFKAGCVPVLIDPGIGLKPLKACLGEAQPTVFIGITRAQVARMLMGWARETIQHIITVGPRPLWRGLRYRDVLAAGQLAASDQAILPEVAPNDAAAILFTSGSTGIPKGVVYRHRHFAAQVDLIRDTYGMQPGEIDLPTFPPFALFDPALGMTTVVPPMDFTRPASVDPAMLVSLIERYQVTNLFGSPALMNTLTRHLKRHAIQLPGLKRILSAGAPVHPSVIERVHAAINDSADIHTPYGATECLPLATIGGRDLAGELSDGNRQGRGICVGRPLEANRVRIIEISDQVIDRLESAVELRQGEIGEICVYGPTVTDTYWRRDAQTRLAKIKDCDGNTWHRMGDLGWIDEQGRIWFCGRKSERVQLAEQTLFTECIEGRVNALSGVYRSALVGVGDNGQHEPVIVVEAEPDVTSKDQRNALESAVLRKLSESPETAMVKTVLLHKSLPVDIRHNAKIRRGQLAEWAGKQLGS